MMIQSLSFIVFGLAMFLIGLKFLPTKLETHRLIFSSCGNSHEINLGTVGCFLPGFRTSMALIGPVMAKYIELELDDSGDIDELHAKLRAPVPPPTNSSANSTITNANNAHREINAENNSNEIDIEPEAPVQDVDVGFPLLRMSPSLWGPCRDTCSTRACGCSTSTQPFTSPCGPSSTIASSAIAAGNGTTHQCHLRH